MNLQGTTIDQGVKIFKLAEAKWYIIIINNSNLLMQEKDNAAVARTFSRFVNIYQVSTVVPGTFECLKNSSCYIYTFIIR